MNKNRIIKVNDSSQEIKTVLYIMHNAYRIRNNHSLAYALSYKKSCLVLIVEPIDEHPRTIGFFQEGIKNSEEILKSLGCRTRLINRNDLEQILTGHSDHIVMDMYYLKEERILYESVLQVCKKTNSSLELVETNTLVPVTETSNKEEYNARTIRKKIHDRIPDYIDEVLIKNDMFFGEIQAQEKLRAFITKKLDKYHLKNDPSYSYTSELSGYLKYGFITPLTIYQELLKNQSSNTDSFIEELIIRRELSYNFVFYNQGYNTFSEMTYEWAQITMKKHQKDHRDVLYTIDDYITFNTHDEYFNTAMKEMVYKGVMHGYMRMYWCKKIIEWSSTYEEAYKTAIYLNNYYFIDGNTPNGYTGIAWCFGKHDRAWKERKIFGKIRYMNSNGLERKFDINQYVKRIEEEVRLYDK